MDKHIANESWFISDGGRAYKGWVNQTKKKLKHNISNHSEHEFVKKNGTDLGGRVIRIDYAFSQKKDAGNDGNGAGGDGAW